MQMDVIKIVITLAQLAFLVSLLFGVVARRVFMKGRWIYRHEGAEFWFAFITQVLCLTMLVYFLGIGGERL